ncbi:MAG: transcription factor S [Euryarchaeota archaeon]|nr:transcription factor S [Euryarchaeota archaeon]
MEDGTEIDLSEATSSSKTETRDRRVIDDADQQRGVLTTKTYICPKCDSDQVYAELQQTRSSDEPETRILTCAECGHGWREY